LPIDHHHRRVVLVVEHIAADLVDRGAPRRREEVPRVHPVDGHLRPHEHPESVGELVEAGAERVVGADQRRSRILGLEERLESILVVPSGPLAGGRSSWIATPRRLTGRPSSTRRPPRTVTERRPVWTV